MFELYFYIFIFILALFFACVKVNNNLLFTFFTFFVFFMFSLVVRGAGFDADMANYENYLNIDSFSIYYIKEPFYWLGSRFLYSYIDSAYWIFIIYDCVFYFSLLLSVRCLKLPKYFPYIVVLFFPSVLGMQNVFRQFIASGFLLFFIALIFSSDIYKFRSKFVVLFLAGLTHNVSFLFSPLLFLKKSGSKLSFLIFSFPVFVLLPIAAGSKSDSNTGDVSPSLYFWVYTILLFLYLIILEFDFKKFDVIYKNYFFLMLYFWFLILVSLFFLGGAQSKRIGLLSLLFSLIPLVSLIELRFKQKLIVRILFILILILPTFVFHNARSLLLTTEQSLQDEAVMRSLSNH